MLFTVFQYVPILEEEIHASKTLNKKADNKASENDGADDDSGDDDENDGDEFFDNALSDNFKLRLSNSKFKTYHEDCPGSIDKIHTPPPKLA